MMGLPSNLPTVILNGPDPGVLSSDQAEATLDVEWAGAVAKKAPVKVVVSKSTAASDGVTVSAQYIVNHKVAPVMTTSYSACEAAAGYAYAQFWGSLWQQAAAEGITSLIASGDSARRVAIRLPRRRPLWQERERALLFAFQHLRGRNRVQRRRKSGLVSVHDGE